MSAIADSVFWPPDHIATSLEACMTRRVGRRSSDYTRDDGRQPLQHHTRLDRDAAKVLDAGVLGLAALGLAAALLLLAASLATVLIVVVRVAVAIGPRRRHDQLGESLAIWTHATAPTPRDPCTLRRRSGTPIAAHLSTPQRPPQSAWRRHGTCARSLRPSSGPAPRCGAAQAHARE
jgi:hypothetical protein